MSNRKYTPRRAGKRWREDAPEYILDCFDEPKDAERYTILFGGKLLLHDWRGDTFIQHLVLFEGGGSYWGEFSAQDARQFRYRKHHRRVRWLDLPEHIRQAAIYRAECEGVAE